MLTRHCHDSFHLLLGVALLHAKAGSQAHMNLNLNQYITPDVDVNANMNLDLSLTQNLNQNVNSICTCFWISKFGSYLCLCLWWVNVDDTFIGDLNNQSLLLYVNQQEVSAFCKSIWHRISGAPLSTVSAHSQAGCEKHGLSLMSHSSWASCQNNSVQVTVSEGLSADSSGLYFGFTGKHEGQGYICKQRCMVSSSSKCLLRLYSRPLKRNQAISCARQLHVWADLRTVCLFSGYSCQLQIQYCCTKLNIEMTDSGSCFEVCPHW